MAVDIDWHVPKFTQPERPKQTVAGSPYTAIEALSYLHSAASVAKRVMGQSHTLAFCTPEHSPRCITKDDANFYIVDDATLAGAPTYQRKIEFQVPWYVSKGYDIIGARLLVTSNVLVPMSLYMTTSTLLDAVATTTASPSPMVFPQTNAMPIQGSNPAPLEPWERYIMPINLFIRPTLPESRELLIKFHMAFYQSLGENGAWSFGNTQAQIVIQSAAIWDHPNEHEVG